MAIAFRQLVTLSATSALPSTVFLPSDPLNGSSLIAVVACLGPQTITEIRHTGADWNLLYEADGPVNADSNAADAVRVQVWAAFNVQGVFSQIGFDFSGGTTERGIIVAEYTGVGFEFPNPADRVVENTGTTGAAVPGTASTGVGGKTRELAELLIAAAATDAVVTYSSPGVPWSIRSQIDVGSPAAGSVCLMDVFSAVSFLSSQVDHTADPGIVNWAIVATSIRGSLQVPADPVDTPTVAEPVTENTDHYGDAIGHLIEQFKSHDGD